MNVYKISWVHKGNPHSLVVVASNAAAVSFHVRGLDEENHINEVAELYHDVHVIQAPPETVVGKVPVPVAKYSGPPTKKK